MRRLLLGTCLATGMGLLTTIILQPAHSADFEQNLQIVEEVYGQIGTSNPFAPGTLDGMIYDAAMKAKELKNAGNEAEALKEIERAAALVQASQ